ncbi:hypothetical protein Tco_0987286 [Tanacetum coccineum]
MHSYDNISRRLKSASTKFAPDVNHLRCSEVVKCNEVVKRSKVVKGSEVVKHSEFHNVPDAKSLWAAIKSRFGGNDKSKKIQRNVLKHQFENFTNAPSESLDKAYDRFQKLISQLEVHAAPSDIDQTDIDDLYNNLRVYEDEMKRSSSSTSNSQNLAFLSSENTSSTNEVSTASGNFGVNTARGTNSSSQVSSTPGVTPPNWVAAE